MFDVVTSLNSGQKSSKFSASKSGPRCQGNINRESPLTSYNSSSKWMILGLHNVTFDILPSRGWCGSPRSRWAPSSPRPPPPPPPPRRGSPWQPHCLLPSGSKRAIFHPRNFTEICLLIYLKVAVALARRYSWANCDLLTWRFSHFVYFIWLDLTRLPRLEFISYKFDYSLKRLWLFVIWFTFIETVCKGWREDRTGPDTGPELPMPNES